MKYIVSATRKPLTNGQLHTLTGVDDDAGPHFWIDDAGRVHATAIAARPTRPRCAVRSASSPVLTASASAALA
jgi:hypothetical protein